MGGSCSACPTCSDGTQNGDETGVDCGGSCSVCPTCSDGLRNGDETGVDCGGSCSACPPTCTLENASLAQAGSSICFIDNANKAINCYGGTNYYGVSNVP